MLNDVKTALRIAVSDYDDEIQDLINAALADLGIVDIRTELLTETNTEPLIKRAVITYCKMNFGYLAQDQSAKFKASYDEQKAQLLMSSAYTTWEVGDNNA